MIPLWLALAWADPTPVQTQVDPADAVLHLRVKREATSPTLARVYADYGIEGPGRGGLHTATGAGVIVDGASPGLLTALHVVSGAREIVLEGKDGATIAQVDPATVRLHPTADLAWIALAPEVARPSLSLAEVTPSIVELVGFPGDRARAILRGEVVRTERRAVGGQPAQDLLIVRADIVQGMSGGAALDEHGHLVGIIQAGSTEQSDLGGDGVVIPIAHAATLLAPATIPLVPPSTPSASGRLATREDGVVLLLK